MFRTIEPKMIKENLIECIADEWMLLTAGNSEGYNMMTASWGFMGEMWGEESVAVVVRPQRYTMEFLEKQDYFTISLYGDNKAIHKICGSMSGRDVDKTKETGLTPIINDKYVYFGEARMVIVVKKQYVQTLTEDGFVDKEILDKWYPNKDLHNMIIGKIEKVLIKE